MNEVVYISFTCKNHIGVRRKNTEQVKVWRNSGVGVFVVNDLCRYGLIPKYLYRYYIFIKFFVFHFKPKSSLYIRQTVSLPLFGFLTQFRKFSYEVNADISKEASTLNTFQKVLFFIFKDSLLKNADKVFFVSEELKNRYQETSKLNYVFPNCVHKLEVKKKLPRGRNIVFVGNEDQKWQGVDIFFEFVKTLPMYQFHVIGNVSKPLDCNIDNIVFFGILDGSEYFDVMTKMDYAIGTLAFYRSGLSEGSALKVRDYVGYDLPVIAGYKDSDFSKSPFFMQLNDDDMKANFRQKIINFCEEWRYRSVHDYIDRSCICEDRELFRIKLIFDEAEL